MRKIINHVATYLSQLRIVDTLLWLNTEFYVINTNLRKELLNFVSHGSVRSKFIFLYEIRMLELPRFKELFSSPLVFPFPYFSIRIRKVHLSFTFASTNLFINMLKYLKQSSNESNSSFNTDIALISIKFEPYHS